MLVLSRRERQKIRLGNSIVLTVVRVSGDRVRLGIEAPKEMLVLRDELEADELEPGEYRQEEGFSQEGEPIQEGGCGRATDQRELLSPPA